MSFALAWAAGLAAVICVLGYVIVNGKASEGWLKDFLVAVLPSATVVAVTYIVAYYFLIRRGLSRDQRLVDSFVEELVGRSRAAPEVLHFSAHPRNLNWEDLLGTAERVTLASRWLSMWTSEQAIPLTRFFERGGKLTAFMLDPSNETAVERAAAQHAGFIGDSDTASAQGKIRTGARRLLKAAEASPSEDALSIQLIGTPAVVLTQTLMLFEGPRGRRLAFHAIDNFRDDTHRSPAVVVDLGSSPQLADYWESERKGFERCSRALTTAQARMLAQGRSEGSPTLKAWSRPR